MRNADARCSAQAERTAARERTPHLLAYAAQRPRAAPHNRPTRSRTMFSLFCSSSKCTSRVASGLKQLLSTSDSADAWFGSTAGKRGERESNGAGGT